MTQAPDVAERAEVELVPEGPAPQPAADDQPARAARSGRRSGRRRRWIVAGAALALVLAWYVGWGSPATLVEHVVVDAPRGISAESIRLASGISAEDHVPAVNADEVRVAIMTAIPAVADVTLARSLPSTIRLRVTARTPLAALEAGSGFFVMDAEGVVYDKVKSAKRLPVVKASTDVGRETARRVLLDLPADLRSRVTRLTANTRDDVTLTLRGGATVRWGSAEDSELKGRVLAGLATVKADKYDVSAPLLPTTSAPDAAG